MEAMAARMAMVTDSPNPSLKSRATVTTDGDSFVSTASLPCSHFLSANVVTVGTYDLKVCRLLKCGSIVMGSPLGVREDRIRTFNTPCIAGHRRRVVGSWGRVDPKATLTGHRGLNWFALLWHSHCPLNCALAHLYKLVRTRCAEPCRIPTDRILGLKHVGAQY
ncbi:hypothetical protein EXN66_Car012086 [Channa argus]|uniref:Uncharacterized protein n=1 Tax=Channa argus TaxID=215402 RepID=A0A6G1Q2C0_CHAAH|nr:hypothetical protein EXN66_Car012086 [Channa argus]